MMYGLNTPWTEPKRLACSIILNLKIAVSSYDHPNTTVVTAKRGDRMVKVGGASLGGGLSKIFMIDEEMVDIRLSAGDDFAALARDYQPREKALVEAL